MVSENIAWIKFKKNRLAVLGLIILSLLIIASVFAPYTTGYDRDEIDLMCIEEKPTDIHLLGTDELGRDVATRILHGGRVSLIVGIAASLMEIIIGVTLGASAGYFGGKIDSVIMGLVDIIMCFPFFIIAITMAAIIGPSMWNLVIIISLLEWTKVARIVRAEVLSLKEREFISAAKALGFNSFEIIVKHIMPNVMAPVIVFGTLAIANGILTEAALSFLGLGVRPPQPSWGNMLSSAQSMRVLQHEWWLWIPPGLMVLVTVLSINFLGDGLRDALDPKLKV